MKSIRNTDLKPLWLAIILVWAGTACSSEDPTEVNEEELITTVNMTFTNTAMASDVVNVSFRDLDGPGGSNPVIDDLTLSANASYTYTLEFLNEQETPADNITAEVRAEGVDHQVFLIKGGNADFTTTYGDQDTNGNPIGLLGTVTTGAAGNGALSIVLVHKPNKSATGVANGNISGAGGEEDIRVQFTLSIQ
ncbi:MAG: type 1 periplasmic binding fold superfamily protein [Roseivirga sp.]|nr:type 1 periplasmic binding fold superfamily protein [Roseivirga sp.]